MAQLGRMGAEMQAVTRLLPKPHLAHGVEEGGFAGPCAACVHQLDVRRQSEAPALVAYGET